MIKVAKITIFLILIVFLAGCGKKTVSIPSSGRILNSAAYSVTERSVVNVARAQIGKPYKWGGDSPLKGFDCSGLVWWVYKKHGILLPRVSWQQIHVGKPVHRNKMRAGDIVFFRIPGGGKSLHAGIYIGDGELFVHSPKSGHYVREESINKGYWQKYFIGARRVF
ncbi:C40 family peptidase [Desulfovibrio gilichinskyi]|uniref:Cell wall-associated hydrolase, NlpC family n=1 Tax=Desulfovibrio gilichinskyi TaxID=1519643 RepID=A0A1X7DH65_9BACT|nr:C40 family peptidase [Desulfovibrio gilichinskyi]SMF14993.1 Cell wall-associated hydrolase, NlpC family [Desulfovibrio gilichinskyi]